MMKKVLLIIFILGMLTAVAFDGTRALSVSSDTLTLLPPVCFVQEMYDKNGNDIASDDVFEHKQVEVRVKFKLAEIIERLWKGIFG